MERLSSAYLSINADLIEKWCRECRDVKSRDVKSNEEIAILRGAVDLVLDNLENSWREVNTDASYLTTALKNRCQACFEKKEGRSGVLYTQYTSAIRINLPQSDQEAQG